MRVVPLVVSLTCLLLVSPAHAGDPADAPTQDPLLAAALECPLTLSNAMQHAYGTGRRPVRAELVLDTEDRLLLRATVRLAKDDDVAFEEWLGPVHAAGWLPRSRKITEEQEIAEASRAWALLEADPNLLRKALKAAIRTDEHPAPAEVALSIAPVARDGKANISLRVGVDGRVRGLRFDPESSTSALEDPTPAPKRVPSEMRTLPSFDVANGIWFNVVQAPTLEAWRGRPILVVVTDPG